MPLSKKDIRRIIHILDLRKRDQENILFKMLKKSTVDDITELCRVIEKDKDELGIDISIREDLFFFLLMIYLETKEEWRLAQIHGLLRCEMKDDKIGLRHFLNLYMPIARDSGNTLTTWSNIATPPTVVGVLLEAETHDIGHYGANISQDVFRTYRSALACKVARDLQDLAISQKKLSYEQLKKIVSYIGRMRHCLAIVQSGSLYSELTQSFGHEAIRELSTPITGAPLYEKYLDLAKKNGAYPQVEHKGVILTKYVQEEDQIFWIHCAPEDRETITHFALEYFNQLWVAYRTNTLYNDAMLDTFASLHYFLSATLPFDRGNSFIAEVIVNAAALLFGQLFSWTDELPDCYAFACANLEQYKEQYRKITTTHSVGKLSTPAPAKEKAPLPKTKAIASKYAMKLAKNPDDSSSDEDDEDQRLARPKPQIKNTLLQDSYPLVSIDEISKQIIFTYRNVFPQKLASFYNTSIAAWGGRSIKKCNGTYDHKQQQIKIPQENLQKFFDNLCDFSKYSTYPSEDILHKNRTIITHLYDAAKNITSLMPLHFVPKQNTPSQVEIAFTNDSIWDALWSNPFIGSEDLSMDNTSFRAPASELTLPREEPFSLQGCDVVASIDESCKQIICDYSFIPKNMYGFYIGSKKGWGGTCLSQCGGTYDKALFQIKIPQEKLQEFFNNLCDFSKDKSHHSEDKQQKRKTIITHLYEAVTKITTLKPLHFIEVEKEKKYVLLEEAEPSVMLDGDLIFFTYRNVLPSNIAMVYDISMQAWGGRGLAKSGGRYDRDHCRLEIPRDRLQTFFDNVCDFSHNRSPSKNALQKRQTIITHLHKAAISLIPLNSLHFIEKEKKYPLEEANLVVESNNNWITFTYTDVLPSSVDSFYSTSQKVWGGYALNTCGGICDKKLCQIRIPEKKLQQFFDDLCDFSKDKSKYLEISEKRRAIITHLHEAAKKCFSSLAVLHFIEKEKKRLAIFPMSTHTTWKKAKHTEKISSKKSRSIRFFPLNTKNLSFDGTKKQLSSSFPKNDEQTNLPLERVGRGDTLAKRPSSDETNHPILKKRKPSEDMGISTACFPSTSLSTTHTPTAEDDIDHELCWEF